MTVDSYGIIQSAKKSLPTEGKVFGMKKSVWFLIASIVQLVIGILAVVSFLILAIGGEAVIKWIPALLLAIALIVIAIFNIAEYRSKEKF